MQIDRGSLVQNLFTSAIYFCLCLKGQGARERISVYAYRKMEHYKEYQCTISTTLTGDKDKILKASHEKETKIPPQGLYERDNAYVK